MNIVKYIRFHAYPTEYLDGWWKYEDEDGNDWYVPVESKRCVFCGGRGSVYHNTDSDDKIDREECPDCEGKRRIEKPVYDKVMTADEYVSYRRQQQYLKRRYGRRLPKQITDYWR